MNDLNTKRASYPRVSDIIGVQTDRVMRTIPIDNLIKAALRGEKVHAHCTGHAKKLFPKELDEECKDYVEAFVEWYDEQVECLILSEERLYDDVKRFTGKPDFVVKLKSSQSIALLDVKVTAKSSKSWGVQLAAYNNLCEINNIKPQTSYIIHLKKFKRKEKDVVKAIPIPYQDLSPYWEVFDSALTCYDYFNRPEDQKDD